MEMKRFLVELGTEEIPARMMSEALDGLRKHVEKWVEEHRLNASETVVHTLGTPRRLVVHGHLPRSQSDREIVEKGPPAHVAFDDDGKPTQALEGFCNRFDVSPDRVETEDRDGGTYAVLERTEIGTKTRSLLEDDISGWFESLNWPKSMRWESSGYRFVRPIRWTIGFFDDAPLDFSVGPVSSENYTHGLRFTDTIDIKVGSIDDYFQSLSNSGIVIDPDQRIQMIEDEAIELAEAEDGEAYLPDELLDEVNFLVESPAPFLGRFDEEFLELPRAVLEEAMISHQKYFPVRDGDKLLPVFIGVRNGNEEYLETVRRGNEKVIRARLSDAVFFFNKDLKTDYKDFRKDLHGIVFQGELGSLFDKTERLSELVSRADGLSDSLEAVSRHIKNDHVMEIVGEFPKLQGTMGRIYAERSGWGSETARLIEEHYHPRGREDELPQTINGQWLALLDRLDTLVGFFLIGERVTGSSDPYGLRRDALGLLRICVFGEPELNLSEWLEFTAENYDSDLTDTEPDALNDLRNFLRDRLYYLFMETTEGRDDEVSAVLNCSWNRPSEALERIKWLVEWRDDERFDDLYTAAQRIGNITRDFKPSAPDPEQFLEPSETDLWENYNRKKDKIHEAIDNSCSEDVLEELSSLRDPIDRFFDDVMVMADDPEIKKNRLSLLASVRETFERIADFPRLERGR